MKRVLCLLGPTASYKTNLAVHLAATLPISIISVDSAMIYREMNIGTAKPTPDILARAPHRLIDFLDPSEHYSVGRFIEDVAREIEAVWSLGNTPLLVGGTMMYFRALFEGLSLLPTRDPAIRDALLQEKARTGILALHEMLLQIDPVAAQKIHPQDERRLIRALEVYLKTGQSLSTLQAATARRLPYDFKVITLMPSDRAALHARIQKRLDGMFAAGFVEEVAALYARMDLTRDLPAMRAVGYQSVWAYLAGEISYEAMKDQALFATRQLAKRQLTWLRALPSDRCFDSEAADLVPHVTQAITSDFLPR